MHTNNECVCVCVCVHYHREYYYYLVSFIRELHTNSHSQWEYWQTLKCPQAPCKSNWITHKRRLKQKKWLSWRRGWRWWRWWRCQR